MSIKFGEVRRFQVVPGRGRPTFGKVVGMRGDTIKFRKDDGSLVVVDRDNVMGVHIPYTRKHVGRYMTAKRRAEMETVTETVGEMIG